jgi:uncharacterized membrane protein/thiol-disulfide isomerase/thioredoxin
MRQLLLMVVWLVGFSQTTVTPDPDSVVRAVLFYSPSCGHCAYVIQETLPPLHEKYGAQLEIIGIDVSQQQGSYFFQMAMQKFELQQAGVPLLVVGDEYLMGSLDIPEQFPGLIEKYLALGGVDYPDIAGLREAIAASQPSQPADETQPTQSAAEIEPTLPAPDVLPIAAPEEALTLGTEDVLSLEAGHDEMVWQRVGRDPLGNGLSIVILIGMLVSVGWNVNRFVRLGDELPAAWQVWAIPLLSMAGFVVAGYLAYVETTGATAVCGPVGDCNTVQQSEYARLFGVLPIGVLGLLGYVAILAAWLVGRLNRQPYSAYADLAMLGMTAFGLAFSIYLTFLEPFVIGATCAWCLSSAILMTALFWLSIQPGRRAYSKVIL